MAEPLTSLFVTEKNKLHSTTGWLFLLELVIDDSNSIRIVDDTAQFTWNSKLYYPVALQIGQNRASSDGSIESLDVAVSNISREVMDLVENLTLIDTKAWVRLVHRTSGTVTNVIEYKFNVLAIQATFTTLAIQLSHSDLLLRPFPANRFSRNRCRWVYKSGNCGYIGGLPTCDLTLDGPNGCRFHGDDETANALPKIHPNRFGGFPGIPQSHS